MKKYYPLAPLILIIIVINIFINNKKEILYFDGDKLENYVKIYQIDENSAVYTNYSEIYYFDKNQNKINLGLALKDRSITIDEIIEKTNYKDTAMDGGSIVAKNDSITNKIANIDFNIIKCNKLVVIPESGEVYRIKDIYIGDVDLENVCQDLD